RVLLSHNMPTPLPIFDGPFHLRALRARKMVFYHNSKKPGSTDDEVGYRLGFLLPLLPKFADGGEHCRSGVVLAAFKIDTEPGYKAKSTDYGVLYQCAYSLTHILLSDNAPEAEGSIHSQVDLGASTSSAVYSTTPKEA